MTLPDVLLVLLCSLMSNPNLCLPIVSWNVHGLGDSGECTVVRDALIVAHPVVVSIQESKLCDPDTFANCAFLPQTVMIWNLTLLIALVVVLSLLETPPASPLSLAPGKPTP